MTSSATNSGSDASNSTAGDDFEFKTYRCEWVVQCGTVDQYGFGFNPYLTFAFPTREQAVEFRPTVAVESEYVDDQWTPIDRPHDYCLARIMYREVLVAPAVTPQTEPGCSTPMKKD